MLPVNFRVKLVDPVSTTTGPNGSLSPEAVNKEVRPALIVNSGENAAGTPICWTTVPGSNSRGARGGSRTPMHNVRWILSPVRLPVPPLSLATLAF